MKLLYYPFGSLIAAGLRAWFGGNLDFWGHFQAAGFILLASILVYLIAKRIFEEKIGLISSFLFSFSPMVLLTGVTWLNEAIALFFLLLSFLLLDAKSSWAIFISGLIFSCALVARLHFVLCIPAFWLYLMLFREKERAKGLLLFSIGASVLVTAWFGFVWYLGQKDEGVLTSLFSQMGEGRILIHPLIHTKGFYERIWNILAEQWLTPLALPFLVLGLVPWNRRSAIFLVWLGCSLTTIVLLPQKVHDHPFYLIAGVPAAAVLAAVAASNMLASVSRAARAFLLAAFLIASLRYYIPAGILSRADGYRIQHIGRKVQELTREEDRIIASFGSSGELLYYSKRLGWPFYLKMSENTLADTQERHLKKRALGYGDPIAWLEYLRGQGAAYLVIADPRELAQVRGFAGYLKTNYSEIGIPGESFLMFDLRSKKPLA